MPRHHTPIASLPIFLALVAATANAQSPWTVSLTPTLNPLPVGLCGAVHLRIYDPSTKDVPRNPQGQRISMADFDLRADGAAVAGNQIDAYHFDVCGCPGGVPGSAAKVTATYPAQSLAANARVRGVTLSVEAQVALAAPKGMTVPPACAALASRNTSSGVSPNAASMGAAPANAASAPSTAGPFTSAAASTVPSTPTTATSNTDPSVACQLASTTSSYAQSQTAISGTNVSSLATNTNCPPNGNSPNSATQTAPPGASGRYLVTVLGFRAYAVSADDPLSRDGFGDESYAAAYIRRYDRRTQQLVSATDCRTRTYGDVAVPNSATLSNSCTNNASAPQSSSTSANPQVEVAVHAGTGAASSTIVSQPRIQGGTWMITGGIKDNDMIPNGPAVAARNRPAQDNAFPWRLWEGTLADGVDALVITPSIWEQDGPVLTSNTVGDFNQAMQQQSLAFYNQWRQQQQTLDSSIFGNNLVQDQISGKRFGMVAAGAQANSANSIGSAFFFNQLSMVATQGIPLGTLLGSSADRPIGLVSTGPDQTALPNRVVVLTREIIEAALAGPALGVIPSTIPNVAGVAAPARGIIMVPFFDGRMPLSGQSFIFSERPAMYQMFIQVERAL